MDTPVGDSEELHKWKFTNKEVLCAEIAGLCHDLGNFTYSGIQWTLRITDTLVHRPLSFIRGSYVLYWGVLV